MKKLILYCFFFVSCKNYENHSFYTSHYVDDLQRIPLIKPFELLNQRYADSNYEGTHGWNLKFHYHQFDGYISHLNVSHVNVINGIIYGHGQDGKTGFPNYWFVINADSKEEYVFKKENDWKTFLESKKIKTENIYSVWNLFEQFKNDAQLPWELNNY